MLTTQATKFCFKTPFINDILVVSRFSRRGCFFTKMEDLVNNYFKFFVEFKYHGVMYKQQCVEKCSSLLSGLPTVSQLDRFSQMVADKEDWIELCDPTRTFQEQRGTRKKGSCSIFLDANYDWESRTWQSKCETIDDSFWLRKNNQTRIFPAMPIMRQFLLYKIVNLVLDDTIVILVKSNPCYLVKSSSDVKKKLLPRICVDETKKQGYDVAYHECPKNQSWYPNLSEINQFSFSKWDQEWLL